MVRIEYGSGTTHGILRGIHIFQDILDNTCIFQDVDQDVLSEFQRSPCSKEWLQIGYTLLLPVLQDITRCGHSHHPKATGVNLYR